MGHVLFAAPDQLDRIINLLGNRHRLGNEVKVQPPAEGAADQLVMHLHALQRQAAHRCRRLLGERRHLGAHPQLAGVRAHLRHAGHGFQR